MKFKNLTLKYAAITAAFMMMACAMNYTYNFLSQSGFADGTVGIIITSVSVLGIVLQTVASSVVDKSDKIDEKRFIALTMTLTAAFSALLALAPNGSVFMVILAVIAFSLFALGMPFLNSMAFAYEAQGGKINYGLARGMGSLAFAIGSSLLGQLWGMFGKKLLPWYLVIFAVITLLLLMTMPDAKVEKSGSEENAAPKESLSYFQFFAKYKKVLWVFISLVLLYFCHMLVNVYLSKIIGTFVTDTSRIESIQGTALFLAAIAELPPMFLFSKISEKIPNNKLLTFAVIFYSIKHILVYLSKSVGMLYFAMLLQMLSYAIIIPATVYFANESVNPEDSIKSQAVLGMTTTIGSLLSSSIGGQLFQHLSVSNTVLVGVIASIIGTVIMVMAVNKKD